MYSDLLKKHIIGYIKNWLQIEKSEQYKEFLLDFLRSFMSTVNANNKNYLTVKR